MATNFNSSLATDHHIFFPMPKIGAKRVNLCAPLCLIKSLFTLNVLLSISLRLSWVKRSLAASALPSGVERVMTAGDGVGSSATLTLLAAGLMLVWGLFLEGGGEGAEGKRVGA